MGKLEGKVAVITAATSGMFVDEGAHADKISEIAGVTLHPRDISPD